MSERLALDIAWSLLRTLEGYAAAFERQADQMNEVYERFDLDRLDIEDLSVMALGYANKVRAKLLELDEEAA